MTAHDPARLNQKLAPDRSSMGIKRNIGKEGITSQKMLCESAATRSVLPDSTYSQMKARSDVSGTDAKAAAQNELRLATSDIATMMADVTTILRMYGHITDLSP